MPTYPAIIHKDADSDFGASFPDFPGCVSAADSADALAAEAREALELHIDGMLEDGLPIPGPMPLEDAQRIARRERALGVVLVEARVSGRSKRINVTIDEGLLGTLDAAASARGMTRSAFLAEGARCLLRDDRRPAPLASHPARAPERKPGPGRRRSR